jgi:hypothetical protein
MRWEGHAACMGEMRNVDKFWLENLKRPLARPRRRWKDNIRMTLTEIGRKYVDGIHLAQDRDQWRAVVNTVMNVRVP